MATIAELMLNTGPSYEGVVPWGRSAPLNAPGVYLISTSSDAADQLGLHECPLNIGTVEALVAKHPEATVDGRRADLNALASRLRAMWMPGETVVYIGLASRSVSKRVSQFYSTPIGARAPHAGGWPVQMLTGAADLWVHYAPSDDPARAETDLIANFINLLPSAVRDSAVDPETPLPFANLAMPGGRRRRHGIHGVREPGAARATLSRSPAAARGTKQPRAARHVTQRVTVADVRANQIRVPATSKVLFPAEPARIRVVMGNVDFEVSWNPRTSGDRERSGVIRFSKAEVAGRLIPSEPRLITASASGVTID